MLNEKKECDAAFEALMFNALDYVSNKIETEKFLSTHHFYFDWLKCFDVKDCNMLQAVIAEKLDEIIFVTMKELKGAEGYELTLMDKIAHLLENLEML